MTFPAFLATALSAFLLTHSALFLPAQSAPDLGDPPPAPSDVSKLPKGPRTKDVTGGFTVNPDAREEVRSFFNAVYRASDGVPMGSTADPATCTAGTNAPAHYTAVLRRLNWFRALAGVPASLSFDGPECVKAQQAALMMSRNTNLNHSPPVSWICYTADGANAAGNSNLALGVAGPDAITGYLSDYGANNAAVGHRRWVLYPQTQVMATGDVPRQGSFLAANATWVFDGNGGGLRPPTRRPYVCWPPAGFTPYPAVYPRWSFAYPNADFTNATVTMRSNSVPIAVRLETVADGYGENTLVWVPAGLDANNQNTTFPFSGADAVYAVTVSNVVIGSVSSNFTYTVTVFDPAVPGADYRPPVISGPSQPSVGQANPYTFTAVANATSYQWRSTRRTPYSVADGAEAGTGNFTVDTAAGYAVQDNSVVASGSYSFHLAHPFGNPVAAETLTFNQAFLPLSNATLTVKSRLGYAADGETARIQVSTNGGTSWQDIFTQSGIGGGATAPIENSFVTRSFPLGTLAGLGLKLRFNYTYASGFNYIYPQSGFAIGWYLDDLFLTNVERLTLLGTNTTATTNFVFSPAQAGNYNLEARALIFTEFPLDWGPSKQVTAVTSAPPVVIVMKPPRIVGAQAQIDFTLQSGPPSAFKLLRADQAVGPWTTIDAAAVLTTNVPAYRFTTPVGGSTRFYRVRTP